MFGWRICGALEGPLGVADLGVAQRIEQARPYNARLVHRAIERESERQVPALPTASLGAARGSETRLWLEVLAE